MGLQEIETFQIIMLSGYGVLTVVWLFLLVAVCRDEFYLWHVLPNMHHLDLRGHGQDVDVEDEIEAITRCVLNEYRQITEEPMIRKAVARYLGGDIADVVMHYVHSM